MGLRFRLHRKGLPGKPDIVLPSRKLAIFVHGCFWHQHDDPRCADSRSPKSNAGYWLPKLARTKERDIQHLQALVALGWKAEVLWECEIASDQELTDRLELILDSSK
jgi:DNA mismatch endonuclease (patch repair protein)